MAQQGDKGERERGAVARGEGSGLLLLLSSESPCRGPGRGAGGSTAGERGRIYGYYYGARAYEDAVINSEFDFPDFCTQRVQHNARKSLYFEFLKNSTLGC
jgi:hypothetical protein